MEEKYIHQCKQFLWCSSFAIHEYKLHRASHNRNPVDSSGFVSCHVRITLRPTKPPNGTLTACVWEQKAKENIYIKTRLYNENNRDLYSVLNIVREIQQKRVKLVRYVTPVEGIRNIYKFTVRKTQGKRSLRRPCYRCEKNKLNFK